MNESTCQRTRELLPWYLNRSLDEAERQEVERHLEACAGCRAELEAVRWSYRLYAQHLPAAAVLAYVAGDDPRLDLGGGARLDRATADEHLAFCDPCREEVAMARESLEALERESAAAADLASADRTNVVPFAPPRERSAALPWGRRLAVAASILFAVVATGGWLTASQRASEHADTVAELERRLEAAEAAARADEAASQPGKEPGADVAAELETLAAELERLRREADQGERKLALLEQRFQQPSVSTAVVPPGVTRSGDAPDAALVVPLGADGATVAISLRGVTAPQPVRLVREGRTVHDFGTVEVPVEDGLPLLTLRLPPGSQLGHYVLELPEADLRQPFQLVAGD
ncbi:MAG TPA: zf-HC2 domain-containing protein [Thermoanaerobaculia bacterium]|nr:zf-HC2 domain-containing protein [Thermoanaerobaculia bacterium]